MLSVGYGWRIAAVDQEDDTATVRDTAGDYIKWFGESALERLHEELDRARALGDDLSVKAWADIIHMVKLLTAPGEDLPHA